MIALDKPFALRRLLIAIAIVPGGDTTLDQRRDRARAHSIFETVRFDLVRAGFAHVRADVETCDPASLLVERATEGAIDFIVMGTHGRRGMRRALMGSVAEAVTRRAPCPVLTMHLPLSQSQPET